MKAIIDLISANGGLIGSVVLVLTLFNVVMSAIQAVFNALKVSEPPILQQIGAAGAAVLAWLTANVPTERKDAPAEKPMEQPK